MKSILAGFAIAAVLLSVMPLSASQESIPGKPVPEVFRWIENQHMLRLSLLQRQTEIVPFTTDGCSGGMSDAWTWLAEILPPFATKFGNQPPWQDCCVEHDKDYWRGDTQDGFEKRRQSDLQLRRCVSDTGQRMKEELAEEFSLPPDTIAWAFDQAAMHMYGAVRLGGGPCTIFAWRWGYGWPLCPLVPREEPQPVAKPFETGDRQ